MDLICKAVDAQADRDELMDHMALRHIAALVELDLADGSTMRIMGLPLTVLRRVHARCVDQEVKILAE